jgi:hypothetical protein
MNLHKVQIDGRTGWIAAGVSPESLAAALRQEGDVIKRSNKSVTVRVGEWVVKKTLIQGGLGPVKRSILRDRYRRPWKAALYLAEHHVLVPAPIAWMETSFCGLILDQTLVCQYLDGFKNVEAYAKDLDAGDIESFLAELAAAVNGLNAAGAYHADLSGKNIFTKDGRSFYFIDFDDISVGTPYTRERRLKNHIQLYDSFCDFIRAAVLDDFIRLMAGPASDIRQWLDEVHQGQHLRRARHINS